MAKKGGGGGNKPSGGGGGNKPQSAVAPTPTRAPQPATVSNPVRAVTAAQAYQATKPDNKPNKPDNKPNKPDNKPNKPDNKPSQAVTTSVKAFQSSAPVINPAQAYSGTSAGGRNQSQRQQSSNAGRNQAQGQQSNTSGRNTQSQSQQSSNAGRNQSQGNKPTDKERVASLTKKAKDLIATANEGKIADPNKFKDILGKLKDLGKDTRVSNLKDKKQTAVAATRLTPPGQGNQTPGQGNQTPGQGNQTPGQGNQTNNGITSDDLTSALSTLGADWQSKLNTSLEGLNTSWADKLAELQSQPQSEDRTFGGGGSDFTSQLGDFMSSWQNQYQDDRSRMENAIAQNSSASQAQFREDQDFASQNQANDLKEWLESYQNEQASRQADYQSMLTDSASQAGAFDPKQFSNLLGELESSKRRQKDWSERSAKAAYKY